MEIKFEFDENGNMALNDGYREILRLREMLLADGVPHVIERSFDGWHICYPKKYNERRPTCSVIEHFGSMGHSSDELEIMGLSASGYEVEGWLTADDVFSRIKKHYEAKEKAKAKGKKA